MAQFEAKITANIDDFVKKIDSAAKKAEEIGNKLQGIGGKLSLYITAPLTAVGVAGFKMAADLEDALGATDQIFKNSSDITKQWASSLSSSYGIAEKEALEYSNMMGSMLVNIGNLTEQEASKQSAKLIELAGDLTAMYGGTTADAVRALTGALKGNNTMLDNYGMAANDAMVKAKALELGLAQQGKEMTLAAKQAATLSLIYEQSASAQGQAAREADGASGSFRALQTEITNLTTEIGSVLLPIITPLLKGLRDIARGFKDLDPSTKQFIVYVGLAAAAVGPFLVALGSIIKIAPLVSTAVTFMTGPIGIAVTVIAAAAVLIIANLDKVRKFLASTIEAVASFSNRIGLTSVGKSLQGAADWVKPATTAVKDFNKSNEEYSAIASNAINKTKDQKTQINGLGEETAKTNKELQRFNDLIKKESLNSFDQSLFDINLKYGEIYQKVKDIGLVAMAKVNQQTEIYKVKIDQLSDALDKMNKKLFGESKDDIKERVAERNNELETLKNIGKLNVPTFMSSPTFGMSDESKAKFYKDLEDQKNAAQNFTNDIRNILQNGLTESFVNAFAGIGEAISNGGNIFKAAGNAMLGALGSVMVQLGELVIATSGAFQFVQKMFANPLNPLGPIAGLAAGAALIALGSMFSSSAQKMGKGGGSSGGYSQSSVSSSVVGGGMNTGPLYNNDRQVVELRLRNTDLVGALNNNQNRNNRLS